MTSLRTTLLLFGIFFLSFTGFTQNVTILPGGITPMQSSTYPRLSYDEIAALTSPHDGDIAYDVTFKCMRLYNGTKWVRLVSDDDLNIPSMTAWSAGGIGYDEGYGISTDNSGNVFVSGCFQGTATFGDTSVVSAGNFDIFITKYNNTGTLQWIRTAGGTDNDISRDIATDSEGNAYITGGIQANATFGSTIISSSGGGDIIIAKYSSNGTLLWVKKGGGIGDETALAIAIDSGNNAYITGYFAQTATFESSSITSAGVGDIFIAKYTSAGALEWIQRAGDQFSDIANSIAVDNNGYVYITGYYHLNTTIGSFWFSSAGETDIFIAKYNPVTSTWAWVQRAGGTLEDGGNSIMTDSYGNVYVTGYFSNTSNFGSTWITSAGNRDIFIAKYNTNGNFEWVSRAGGVNSDVAHSIIKDSNDNIYIIGYFNDTAYFGNIQITSTGNTDFFVAKYYSNGTIQWVQRGGNIVGDLGNAIAIDNDNNIYATGYFQNTAKFGAKNLTNAGATDIFVARIKE